MLKGLLSVVTGLLIVGDGGCASDKPHEYGEQRPDPSSLDAGGGLQSKDLLASSGLVADLLADRKLNSSKEKWTIVVERIENHTTDPYFNYEIFSRRFGTLLQREGGDRVALIENKARFHKVQNQELEKGGDNFGEGAPGGFPAGIQPDYALTGRVDELRNAATSTYRLEFQVLSMKTREILWTNEYIVKAAR